MITTSSRVRRAGLCIGGAALVAVLGSASPALAGSGSPAPTESAASAVPDLPSWVPVAAPATFREAPRLRHLVSTLAHESHGTVVVTQEDDFRQVTGLVTARSGAFEIDAFLDDDPDGVANWREACRSEANGADGRICRVLLEQNALGVWDRTYPEQPGRRLLLAAATTKAGGTLLVMISNLTETGVDGAKVIGPDWQQAGLTVAEVRAALAATGLTVR